MPTQVPLFRPTRELRFSAADIAAIRAAEGTHGPAVELHHRPRASFVVIFRRAMMTYIALLLLIGAHSLLGRLWTAIQDFPSEPTAQVESQPEQADGWTRISGGGQWVGPMVPSLSEIEAEVNTLPLRQPPASLLLDDMVEVEPPELTTDGQSELEETAEWQLETPEGAQILDPGSKGQSECQAVPQPEITHSDAAAREVENNEGPEYEADARHEKTEAEKGEVKKPLRPRTSRCGAWISDHYRLCI